MRWSTPILIFAVLICGCSHDTEPALRLGTNVWAGYEPLYMAREKGYLDQQKIRLIEYSSTSQVLQAFRNGLIDAAGVTLDEAMLLLETGEEPQIFIVADISHGADTIIGQPWIKTLSDIEGKRVGSELSALGAYMLTRATEKAGIDPKTVTNVHKNADEHELAFISKEVDAVITFEPVHSKLVQKGGNLLFDSKEIPGEIVDIFIVRRSFLSQNPKTLEHLKQAWYKALGEIKDNPENSAEYLGMRMKLDVQQTLVAFEGLRLPSQIESDELLSVTGEKSLLPTAEKLASLMHSNKLIKRPVNVHKLFANGLSQQTND